MDRRSFISNLAYGTAGLALACTSFGRRDLLFAQDANISQMRAAGYGELFPTAAKNTGEVYVNLPKGFEYTVIGKQGSTLADGRFTPALHDGMATFKVGNELRIVRNHEVTGGGLPREGSAIGARNHYDETAGGGTTTLVVDPKTRLITRDFVSLSGTLINCAGGPTPWGSWISCEETVLGETVFTGPNGVKAGGFLKPHGYCFEVDASANTNLPPVPLKAMGRFIHEAAAVDRRSGIVYLTEDFDPCGFYRFLPKRNRRLAEGGVLQMLAVAGRDQYDTRTGQKQNAVLNVKWVTIADPDPAAADNDPQAVSKRGRARGAAIFNRLEGCDIDAKGNVYFVSTSGGENRGGQIWLYRPTGRDEGQLILRFESPSRSVLDMPDNICFRPGSPHLFICEDGDYKDVGATPENFIRIVTPDGRIADFAENITPNFIRSEFAGSTFSPDGKTFFVNLQQPGVTLAIWGDWSKFKS